jgi:hypothetical protein
MQSVPGGQAVDSAAHKHDRHFANPSVGWANFPPGKAGGSAVGLIKRLPVFESGFSTEKRLGADWTWRAVPAGAARLTVFISVSAHDLRTPMNSPLRSVRLEKRAAGSGF